MTAGSVTIKSRAVDDSGNLEIPNELSITVPADPSALTIWPSTAMPSLVDAGADNPVALGVKFRSDVVGTITGIRFYKASANTGTHVGNLWSSTGALLATATFTNETDSGWQQVNFSSPVLIDADTVYVASYHANAGHYSVDWDYFATTGVDNPPLHALADGESGGNGVFAYGDSSAFPTQTGSSANYWVDVVFNPSPAPTADKVGIRRNTTFFLDLNGSNAWDGPAIDGVYGFGAASDVPVAGDWNGDGVDDLGIRRNTAFFLDLNGNRVWDGPAIDGVYGFGAASDIPVIGDWNGDGVDDLGVRRNSAFFLDLNGSRVWDAGDGIFGFGGVSDLPVIGDWNADGVDDLGVRRNNLFFLDLNGNRAWDVMSDGVFPFGIASDLPVIGDWNADGIDDFGIRRLHEFYLDLNGDRVWEIASDGIFPFGLAGDTPVAGKW
jgi:hypothetical protein